MNLYREVNTLGDLLTINHVTKAMENLIDRVHRTPLKQSTTLNTITGASVYLKLENLQKTGSFKVRGALNKILSLSEGEASRGIVAASAGNHAQGVALAATIRGVHAKIYMPEKTPKSKVSATKHYGAETVLAGETYQEAYELALEDMSRSGATYIHAFDDYDVMAGQGTVALEMLQQNNYFDVMFVPVGGGGLISGVAASVKAIDPTIKIVGVQAESASATYQKFSGDYLLTKEQPHTIADGILVKEPGRLTYPIIQKYVDDIVTVTDEEIAHAILFMLEREKLFVEGAGVAALAAIVSNKVSINNKNVGCIISGGNADYIQLPMYQKLYRRAL